MAITYRTENPGDIASIHKVNGVAFPTEAEANLVDALRSAERLIFSLVAESEGQIIGHAAFSPVTLSVDSSITKGVGLGPLAILPEYQRQGIGTRLVREGLGACASAGCGFVVVLGDPAYYQRFGFARASDFGLGNEYGVDAEFMVVGLLPGGIPTTSGVVRYAPEFALVE